MIEFTTDGYILDASPLFLHSVGYSLNEIVQQHHAMFCMKEDTDSPSYREFWRIWQMGTASMAPSTGLANKAKEIWLEATYFPVSQGGKIIKIIKIASDVTVQHDLLMTQKSNI